MVPVTSSRRITVRHAAENVPGGASLLRQSVWVTAVSDGRTPPAAVAQELGEPVS